MLFRGRRTHVVEGEEEREEDEPHARAEQRVRPLAEGGPLDQRRALGPGPARAAREPRAQERGGDGADRAHQQRGGAQRPREADAREQLAHEQRVGDAADARAAGGEPDGEAAAAQEVGAQQRDGGRELQPAAEAVEHALGQEQGRVRGRAEGGGEEAGELQGEAGEEGRAEEAGVEGAAGEGAEEEEERDLQGADPGDGAGGEREGGGVVGLEEREGEGVAPAVEDDLRSVSRGSEEGDSGRTRWVMAHWSQASKPPSGGGGGSSATSSSWSGTLATGGRSSMWSTVGLRAGSLAFSHEMLRLGRLELESLLASMVASQGLLKSFTCLYGYQPRGG